MPNLISTVPATPISSGRRIFGPTPTLQRMLFSRLTSFTDPEK